MVASVSFFDHRQLPLIGQLIKFNWRDFFWRESEQFYLFAAKNLFREKALPFRLSEKEEFESFLLKFHFFDERLLLLN